MSLAVAIAVATSIGTPAPGSRIAALPVNIEKSLRPEVPLLTDEIVLTAIAESGAYEVIGKGDVESLLAFERQKDLLACDDASCFAEIGSALGAEHLVSVSIGKVEEEWLVTAKLIDIGGARVTARQSDFVKGGVRDLLAGLRVVVGRLLGVNLAPASSARLSRPVFRPPPVERNGSISLTSVPQGARCELDGKAFGETPCTASEVPAGTHRVALSLDGYVTNKQPVLVFGGRPVRHAIGLTPKPVVVSIKTRPPGAAISIDGEAKGKSDLKLALPPATYTVETELSGYRDKKAKLAVKVGSSPVLALELESGLSGSEALEKRMLSIARWSLTGLTAAAAGLWAWQGLRARSIESKVEAAANYDASLDRDVAAGKRAALVADISLATMIVAGTGTALLWLTVDF